MVFSSTSVLNYCYHSLGDHIVVPKSIEDTLQTQSNGYGLVGPIVGKVTLKSELFEDANRTCFYFTIRDNSNVPVNVHSFDAQAQELHRQIQVGHAFFISNFRVVKKELLDTELHLTPHSILRPYTLPNSYAPIPIQRKFLSNVIQNGKKGEYFSE